MKIVTLTGNQSRHINLLKSLAASGHELIPIIESKINQFNEEKLPRGTTSLLSLHKSLLEENISKQGPPYVPKAAIQISGAELRSEALINKIISHDPDLIVTYGCGIVPELLIASFPGRVLGSHQGLPQYFRGSGSNFFAVLNDEACRMGVSVHYLDQGVDTGAVIFQRSPIPEPEDTYYSYSSRLIEETASLYLAAIKLFSEGKQPSSLGLPHKGRLYQRKDFTELALFDFFKKLNSKTFFQLYSSSSINKRPELINACNL